MYLKFTFLVFSFFFSTQGFSDIYLASRESVSHWRGNPFAYSISESKSPYFQLHSINDDGLGVSQCYKKECKVLFILNKNEIINQCSSKEKNIFYHRAFEVTGGLLGLYSLIFELHPYTKIAGLASMIAMMCDYVSTVEVKDEIFDFICDLQNYIYENSDALDGKKTLKMIKDDSFQELSQKLRKVKERLADQA